MHRLCTMYLLVPKAVVMVAKWEGDTFADSVPSPLYDRSDSAVGQVGMVALRLRGRVLAEAFLQDRHYIYNSNTLHLLLNT